MSYQLWKSKGILRRIQVIVLSISIIGTIIAIVYINRQPMVGDMFTDFYIFGESGEAALYPSELHLGEEGKVIIGIVNQEKKTMNYRVDIESDGQKIGGTNTITLNDGEKWEHEEKFKLNKVGENQKVDFLLYREGDTTAYRTLLLWVSVK